MFFSNQPNVIPAMMPTVAGAILTLQFIPNDSICGLPGCCCCYACVPSASYIQDVYAIPLQENPYFNLADMNEMIHKINRIVAETHVPIFPILFTHFCIPFSPICLIGGCHSRRTARIRQLLDETNARVSPHGIHFEMGSIYPAHAAYGRHRHRQEITINLCRHGEGIPLNIVNNTGNNMGYNMGNNMVEMQMIPPQNAYVAYNQSPPPAYNPSSNISYAPVATVAVSKY